MFLHKFFLLFLIINCHEQESKAVNFFNELFDDLRVGSLDKDYLIQKLGNSRLKCLQGSYFFNGSCYVISNRKYKDRTSYLETDNIYDLIKKGGQKSKNLISNSLVSRDLALSVTRMPNEASWRMANQSCANLSNDSSLIYFNNENEYEYLLNLLKELNFADSENKPDNILNENEQKYYIGLTFINSTWKWIDGTNISNKYIEKFSLNKIIPDSYRKCAYLLIRDNGEVNIELSNCQIEKQPYICKYILDRCFNNTQCGRNGDCINRPNKKSFECKCRIFYDGDKCQNWSTQGVQMLITVGLVILAFAVVILMHTINHITFRCTGKSEKEFYVFNGKGAINNVVLNPMLPQQRMSIIEIKSSTFNSCLTLLRKKLKLFIFILISLIFALFTILIVSYIRYKMIEYKIERYERKFAQNSTRKGEELEIDASKSKLTVVLSYDVCKLINDQFFEDYILVFISFPLTVLIYLWNAYKCNIDHEHKCRFSKFKIRKNLKESTSRDLDDTVTSDQSIIQENETRTRYKKKLEKERSKSVVHSFCFTFSYLCRRLRLNRLKSLSCTMCGLMCSCNFSLPVPINPFSKRNRFITAIIYAAYTYNILKIFEYLIVGDQHIQNINNQSKHLLQNASFSNLSISDINKNVLKKYDEFSQFAERGILMDLIKQICNVVIIGLRYYPVLLCVELKRKSKLIYFMTTLYVTFLFFMYLYMNIFCLLSASQAIKEANSKYSENLLNSKLNLEETTPISQIADFKLAPIPLAKLKLANDSNLTNTRQLLYLIHYLRNDQLKVKSDNLISIDISHNISTDSISDKFKLNTSELDSIKNTLFVNNIMYEKFLFYAVLCMITLNMIFEFSVLVKDSVCKFICRLCCIKHDQKEPKEPIKPVSRYQHELNYTMRIYRPKKPKAISYVRYLFERYIYKNDEDFRYSKQFINTQIIAFILLYYITCIIIRKSKLIVNLSSNILIFFINFIFKADSSSESSSFIINSKAQLNMLIKSIFDHISNDIVAACCLTSGIYILQLFTGIRSYKRNVLNSYKGIYRDIPSPKFFSKTKITSSSLHYSGYSIGYLLWGYLILFEVCVVIIIIVKFLIKFYFITENLAKIVLPITTIFLFKRIIIWYLSKYFFVNKSRGFSLRNHKLYFILNHFNFFFDCFLGSFVCFMRMSKSSLAALFFMPRLDYSIFGRQLERTDLGFISYVTFIHMDVNLTHPVKVAFCEFLQQSLSEQSSDINKRVRNRWNLAVTLAKNPTLRRQRKKYLESLKIKTVGKRFKEFLDKKVKNFFTIDKSKSQSTPNLLDCDEDFKSKKDNNKSLKNELDEVPYYVNLNQFEINKI